MKHVKELAMKTLKIEVSNSIYEHIIFFLKSLPKNLIHISYETKPIDNSMHTTKDEMEELFKNSSIETFQEISSPLKWQKKMRDEWQ